jgi:hypothetical protein
MDKEKGKLTCLEWGHIHFTCNRSREREVIMRPRIHQEHRRQIEREKEEEATYRRRRQGVTRRRDGGDGKEDIWAANGGNEGGDGRERGR